MVNPKKIHPHPRIWGWPYLEKKVFEDITKLRILREISWIIPVDLKSNDSVLRGEGKTNIEEEEATEDRGGEGRTEPLGRHREGLCPRVSQRKPTLLKPRFRSLASLNVRGCVCFKSLSLCYCVMTALGNQYIPFSLSEMKKPRLKC